MPLQFVDPDNPEKGYILVSPRNPHIHEYEEKLGTLSLTDGLPVIREVPEGPRRANFGSIERFQEESDTIDPAP